MPAPIDPRTLSTGSLLLLLAGLAALGALAANIILPAFPDIGTELRACPTSLEAADMPNRQGAR